VKHSVEEIKKMLEQVSSLEGDDNPFPWAMAEYKGKYPLVWNGRGDAVVDSCDGNPYLESDTAKFIAAAPQIISDLVEELERLRKQNTLWRVALACLNSELKTCSGTEEDHPVYTQALAEAEKVGT
jgi:hypothetical protein